MEFIQIENLSKNYYLGKTIISALKGISVSIKKGDYACIAGPSGAGKSTLLNIIGLIDTPTSGEIFFDNNKITDMKEKKIHKFRKGRISFIFQTFNLIPVLSAYENIEFPLLLLKIKKRIRKEMILKIANEVGIQDYLTHKPDELSGGQRQRVAIARAIVTKPEVIIADEPTANLDSNTGNNILLLMKKLNREENTTFLIASHDNKIMLQADRLIKIIDGKIIE